VRKKNATISDILSTRPLNISFRRNLVDDNLQSWNNLILRIAEVHLNEQTGIFKWTLKVDGQFSMSSMYQALSF
jgi:hypothetical protein